MLWLTLTSLAITRESLLAFTPESIHQINALGISIAVILTSRALVNWWVFAK